MYPQDVGEDPDARYLKTKIAGLQFYSYDAKDDLIGRIRPVVGDRFQLIRQPRNRHDKNAIEVWFHNGQHMLGHVPAFFARDLAPEMDAGKALRGYAINGGNGDPWSAGIMIVGDGIPQYRFDIETAMEIMNYEHGLAHEQRTRFIDRAERNAESFSRMREQRRQEAARALAVLLVNEVPAPPTPPKAPPKSVNRRRFDWWDEIPTTPDGPVVRTRTQWGQAGFKVRPRCKPYAFISYGRGRKYRMHELFGGHQVAPKKPLTAAQIAAGYARNVR